jgi:beta-N-acetylhexosaminidase
VNFAPVVDVAVEPNNPAIVKPERSYSNNEDSVALFAKEVVKEHRKYGVVTVLKHFPGHGSSKDDTHFGIADVTKTWSERELKPYKLLIDSGYVDAIMTAHIVNKNLDKNGNPGTLSKDILDGILRKKLGYNGVVFSDDMQMHAIAKQYGLEESIRLAVNAGVDIMCFSNNIPNSEERTVDKVHAIIKKFVQDGQIPKERIDESFRRIMKLKGGLKRDDVATLEARIQQLNATIAAKDAEIKTLRESGKEVKKKKK